VYRARHIELKTEHVIKVVLPSLANDRRMVELFCEEARKLQQLHSDAIVDYGGFNRDERGLLYLVMEYVEGESLAAILARRRLEADEVLRLRDRLAAALADAHDKGIIHRDISPENIILPDGRVERAKLIDFGIAKSMDRGDATLIAGDFAGKYAFASPEQSGLFGGRVDLRSDIYSLGLVLAAAAIGFGNKLDMGNTLSAVKAARQRVPDLSAVPAPLRPVIVPMLQPRPEDRPASMRALLNQGNHPRSNRRLVVVAAVVLGAALLVGVLVLVPPWPPPVSVAELQGKVQTITSGYQCAALRSQVGADRSIRVSGFVPTPGDVAKLRSSLEGLRGIGPLTFTVGLRVRPYCEAVSLLDPLVPKGESATPRLALASGGREVRVGEFLALDIRTADFDGYIYVDYFAAEDGVLHLLPSRADPINLKPQRNSVALRGSWVLGGSTGEQLVSLIATKRPFFSTPRHETEKASDYLASLSAAMGKMPPHEMAAAILFFDLREGEEASKP
jgi:hypothetical protein